ncbi:hypothetical protein LCGC14_2033280 [marine sediment metagenome]|uniref:Uncharacterized protein n=1 Tax=marine sediment metagenome TaxID=412755 RepID=A0A0F9EU98_9ZZZZ
MPHSNNRVPQDADVFRYRSTQHRDTLGVPTAEQCFAEDQQLIEIDTVVFDNGGFHFTGLLSWVSISQLIVIEEVPNDA